MTYGELYQQGVKTLQEGNIPEAALDARYLLEAVCNTNRNDLLVHGDRSVSGEQVLAYEEMIHRRKEKIPLQHITGKQEFMGLEFIVNEHVLIPRQDTEILVEEVMKYVHDGFKILDVCTGSGCILLSLMHYSNRCIGTGVDISEAALDVAKKNSEKLQLDVTFLQSDLFENVPLNSFDIIVSNPPYIRSDVIPTLMEEVKDHEPMLALDGFEDGLYFYRKIVDESVNYLAKGGYLFFEIGYDQGEDVSSLLENQGFDEVQIVKDYAGLDRVVYGKLPML